MISWFNENAGFVSVILAAVTAGTAIYVPIRIANKQNKIALFEQRLNCYEKIEAIRTFLAFSSEFESFEDNSDSPIEKSKEKYLEIHDLLSDSKAMSQIMFSPFWKNTFVRNCLENDCTTICTCAFLTEELSIQEAKEIENTLTVFVYRLFDSQDTKIILEKRDSFIACSAKFEKISKDLMNKLLMEERIKFKI